MALRIWRTGCLIVLMKCLNGCRLCARSKEASDHTTTSYHLQEEASPMMYSE